MKPVSWRAPRFLLVLPAAFGMLLTACQSTMSVEEARKVSAQFGGRSFVPPPRTINDIMSLLDRERLADPEAAGRARGRAEQPPPASTSAVTLAAFYYERGLAAREVGRTSQEIGDLTRALDWAERGGASPRAEWDAIATELAWAEGYSGNFPRAEAILRRLIATTPAHRRGALIKVYNMAAFLHGLAGDLEATEVATARLVALVDESRTWQNQRPGYRAQAADAEGRLAQLKGQYAQGEAFFREAIQWLARDPATSKSTYVDRLYSRIALVLVRQGRLLEAEKEARVALLGALTKQGRYSAHTARMLRELTYVIFEQGRNAEAEALARAAVEIYRQTGSPADSTALALARSQLGAALAAQGRWQEALAEYEAIKAGLAGDPQGYERYLRRNLDWALAILGTGRPAQALEMLQAAFESNRRLLGAAHPDAAEARGLMGMAHVALGDRARALREFQAATPILLARGAELEDESTSQPARERRRTLILGSHVGLLADIRGTPLERQAGVDVVAEAFRLADVARGRSVQRALDAGGARAAAGTPALAELIRREQDATKQISALHGVVVNALGSQQDPKTVGTLRTQIDTLRRARDSLAAHIAREFPAYAQLIDPAPATLDRARSALRPGEALIATFVSADRTFVWAIPRTGAVAFAAAPIGEEALQDAVTRLRAALDPGAKTVGEIPPFDLLLAHRLYQALLAPVAAGWRQADSLLIVGHGALGQLPLALLPTKPATLGPEREPIFANYRAVPWLVRTHAVTVLPSVTALATLRALPSANPRRRPFVGFGDPYFSHEQVQRAARRGEPREALAPPAGAAPIMLRSSPGTQGRDTAQLGMLPRLPETAEEIRSIARALDADPTGDVFIGARANELAVKTLDLSGYRVIAFATHGLVPGDLDGLAEPALALSAPGVAEVDGDGLLTMDEILGLRLNADWVVLSACNTASGKGAGAEAVSGLGRAFFYAGARALLVSNWPVETTSARALTTGLFRRQGAAPGLSRTGALQQTLNWMIDEGVFVDPRTSKVAFSYAHPIFWAPFTLVGDGGGGAAMGP